ncbi:receptor-like protein 15 [Hordeum vulgare subsp. vulgare]|uniref:Leucine-rich repeat-containing N-terminal plant-type domain-containing protein n=1 Tax=Hordeum vulgare subsp. vulgare TaxID=112509 RepID=A0A8I6XE95_HORVV|nr:receptor-like protein 15 [Hordeum vulgare subsp. vulgare]
MGTTICFPWGSLPLVTFLLLQTMVQLSSACSMEERAVLMDIRSSLRRAHSMVSPDLWGHDDDECCSWKTVTCNNSTRRVTHLDLSLIYAPTDAGYYWYLNLSVFSAFHELQSLDLSFNYGCSLSFEGLVGLPRLRYLDLSGIALGGGFLEFIGAFVSLEVLALNLNNLTGALPEAAFNNLRNLRELNMSMSGLSGNLPASLFALPHLKILDLSNNIFDGYIPISSSSRPISLEVLDLSSNHLTGILPITAFKNIRNLNLGGNLFSGFLPVSILGLPYLKFLDLSSNHFEGGFPINFSLEQIPLEVLHFDGNNMSGALPTEGAFENLRNLRQLYLSNNQFSGNIPTFAFQNLRNLRQLYLSHNQFSGNIPTFAFQNLQNLRELSLSSNQLIGNIPSLLFSLPHIELLNLSSNFFSGPIPINQSSNLSLSLKSLRLSQNKLSGRFSFIWLADLIKLEEIDLSGNANLVVHVNIPEWTPPFQLKQLLLSGCDLDKSIIAEPHFLDTQHHLEVLDLSNNNLSASMPNWLFTKEATLHELYLGNNSLTGSLDPIWHTQSFLQVINLHMNHVTGQLPANISLMFPRLLILDFSSNNFFGHIPTSLCEINCMTLLDLSNNKFSGEVPACVFTNYPILLSLKVSNNKLGGLIFGGMNNLSIMSELYLDGNKFEGAVRCDLSGGTLMVIDLHDNELSGKLDTSLWNMSSLKVLNLAGNRITGKIHPQICGFTRLELLDISSNNLTGSVPNCSCMLLHFLNLSGNSLSSHISYPFFNTSSLIALDIRNNQFAGNLDWVRSLDNIRLLSLGGNKFEGQVTTNLCELQHLRIIDLSHNKLSGSLPSCIGSFFFKGDRGDQIFQVALTSLPYSLGPYDNPYGLKGFSFTTKGNMYTYGRSFFVSMSGIDLSANMLHGEIPWELGNMSHIKSLNLSYNFFVGPIPTTFGGMEEIESLDLSHNELSGPIPWQLARLCSLGVFSVAYNNLSGCIPNSGQLGSFGMDSYLANTDLHKITHGNMCAPGPDPMAEEDVGETSGDPILYMVMAAGFILAFWATVAFSLFHPYGRSVMFKL